MLNTNVIGIGVVLTLPKLFFALQVHRSEVRLGGLLYFGLFFWSDENLNKKQRIKLKLKNVHDLLISRFIKILQDIPRILAHFFKLAVSQCSLPSFDCSVRVVVLSTMYSDHVSTYFSV